MDELAEFGLERIEPPEDQHWGHRSFVDDPNGITSASIANFRIEI